MHELSITQSILDISLKAAREQGAARIRSIRLRLGPFSGIVPECVQMYLDLLAKGTPAEGARLEVRQVPLPGLRARGGNHPGKHRLPLLRQPAAAPAFREGIYGGKSGG